MLPRRLCCAGRSTTSCTSTGCRSWATPHHSTHRRHSPHHLSLSSFRHCCLSAAEMVFLLSFLARRGMGRFGVEEHARALYGTGKKITDMYYVGLFRAWSSGKRTGTHISLSLAIWETGALSGVGGSTGRRDGGGVEGEIHTHTHTTNAWVGGGGGMPRPGDAEAGDGIGPEDSTQILVAASYFLDILVWIEAESHH
jgi:hypothetical protein